MMHFLKCAKVNRKVLVHSRDEGCLYSKLLKSVRLAL